MIFDTHVHYDDEAFDEDRDSLLSGLKDNGVEAVVNIGANIQRSQKTLELTEKYPFIYGTVGVHPSETEELNETLLEWLEEAAKKPKVVAVGEIGLDYHWEEPEREHQKYWFVRQLELARKAGLPVVIHSRDAAKDTMDIMKDQRADQIGGVIHCFSYGIELAREFLNMGFYLGIGGVVTFTNAKKLKEVVSFMPLERLVLETDCPYLAPVPYRGKRNSSLNLSYVAAAVSQLKGISQEAVIAATSENAKKLYRLEE